MELEDHLNDYFLRPLATRLFALATLVLLVQDKSLGIESTMTPTVSDGSLSVLMTSVKPGQSVLKGGGCISFHFNFDHKFNCH